MLRLTYNILFLCFLLSSFAQNELTVPVTEGGKTDVFTIVEEAPEFPGGPGEMYGFIGKNVLYPSRARELGISGKCYYKFIVTAEGKITNIELLKGVPSCSECDAEALRVIKMMPDWTPGKQQGKPVAVYYNLPVSFKITEPVVQPEKTLSPDEQARHDRAMKYYYEGHKYDQQQYYEKALEKFDLSLSIEPQNKYALFDKAKMHLNLGNKVKACEIWKDMSSSNIRKEEAEEFIKKYCN